MASMDLYWWCFVVKFFFGGGGGLKGDEDSIYRLYLKKDLLPRNSVKLWAPSLGIHGGDSDIDDAAAAED